jgi:hypothetical protein
MIEKALNLNFSDKLNCQATVDLSFLYLLQSAKKTCFFMSKLLLIYLAKKTCPNLPAPNFLPISKSDTFSTGI